MTCIRANELKLNEGHKYEDLWSALTYTLFESITSFQGDLRASKKDYDSPEGRQYGGIDLWHHFDCFVKLRHELEFWDLGSTLPGFKQLEKEDQDKVKSALPAIKP